MKNATNRFSLLYAVLLVLSLSCAKEKESAMKFTGAKGEVKVMTLDPGHFHAALVQKTMYAQVSPTVHVYAPEGPDVEDHMNRITGFNTRAENPTSWNTVMHVGPNYLREMLTEKPGNVVVISGNNTRKAEYLEACVSAGLNVLADKPMCKDKAGFALLQKAFATAQENGILLYDIMTERFEITTLLQKALANNPAVFGELQKGSPEKPAVIKESVHHFFKYVSGNPIKRPAWYFDTEQQGEGIVDVTTHLVDIVQWATFPGQIIDYARDIEIVQAKRWPTLIKKDQFATVTRLPEFPDFLKPHLNAEGVLEVFANGEIIYKLRGVHAKVVVFWNYEAPQGAGDTHFSVMRGSKSEVYVRQGAEQNYRPELYLEVPQSADKAAVASALETAISGLNQQYPGLELEATAAGWRIVIPDKYHNGHEAHFGQVTERYLEYLVDGKLPDWEVPNMVAKYYTTTTALEQAMAAK
jgi:predicted dehydrogenase